MYPTHGAPWQAVAGVADQALYRAKDEGRNRVVVAAASTAPVMGNMTAPREATAPRE
jgi:hypothetical protein